MTSIAEEHMGFADELNDAKLLNLAVERMKKADSTAFVPAERLNKKNLASRRMIWTQLVT